MSTSETALRPYEVVVLMQPDANLEDQKELFRKNKGIIEQYKGSVFSLDTWGKRTLATPIGKLKKALYFHSTFEAGTQAVAELERTMRINDKVVRFMHARLDERVPLKKYLESYKKALVETANKEREREAKYQARKMAAAEAAKSDRAERGERPERADRGERSERFDRPEKKS